MTTDPYKVLGVSPDASDEEIKRMLVRSMLRWGRRFLWAGYGHRFMLWLQEDDPQPYGSNHHAPGSHRHPLIPIQNV